MMPPLDKALWHTLSPLFDKAFDLESGPRADMMASIARESSDLAAALEQLLIEHDRVVATGFLETPPDVGSGPSSLAGQTVGAYTLERPLGVGGMGAVWLARRSDGRFEGAVAIKLVDLAVLDRIGEERFRREGTLLARLSHPKVARLLDAGVTLAGQPFLVLEYVEGTRVDEYAAAHRLGIEARLEIFLQVADAVAHAHANLVVHRDLKPSNVLVDTLGQVKLLDFGIASLLDNESGEPTSVTLTGARALTPECAAPEQVGGLAVTTATDVYALGVLLYRLLVGRHPTAPERATHAAIFRALTEHHPARLSEVAARLTAGDPETTRILDERVTTRDRLRRACRGDLDTIVGKALKKDPVERYQTVTSFADDVRRHLRNEPVAARPDRWTYRARKFVHRHRTAAAAGAVVIATLVAAVAITTTQMLEARRQRDRAEFQARRAQASSEFMRNLVTQIGNEPMTMREVLDRGRVALEQQYGGDPAFVARMLMQLSGPYIELGDDKTSAEMMDRALQIAKTLDDPDLLAATHCGTAYDLVEQRKLDEARSHLVEGARYLGRVFSPGLNAECAVAETHLALAERRYDDAVRHAGRAVDLLESDGNTTTTRFTSAVNNLSTAYGGAGRLPEAFAAQRRVTEVSRRIGRGETISVVISLQNEAALLRRLGRWLEADGRFVEAIDLARHADRAGRVPATVLANRARLLVSLARGDEALALLRQAREQGDLSPAFAAVGQLADALLRIERGDVKGARTLYDGLQPPERTVLPRTHAHVVPILAAEIARAEGRAAEARATVDRAIEQSGFPGTLTATQPELLEFAARLSLELADQDTAIRRCRDAIRVANAQFGADVPNAHIGRAGLTLGRALASQGSAREARVELERAAATLEPSVGALHPWTVEARTRLAGLNP